MIAFDASQLVVLSLLVARSLPLGLGLSLASRGLVPLPVALSLSLALAFGLAPGVPALGALAPLSFALLTVRELCLGVAFAVCALAPVLALGWAVRLGEGALPPVSARSRAVSQLVTLWSAFVFFALAGHRALVLALSQTLSDVPLASFDLDARALALGLASFVAHAFALSFSWCLPLLACLLIAALLLALAGRAFGVALRGTALLPGFVLLAALLSSSLSARLPDAVRDGLTRARALVRDVASAP